MTMNLCAFTVIIDPGHGGKDTGVLGTYLQNSKDIPVYEKDITLRVSQKPAGAIKQRYPDIQIFLTREDDSFVSLEARQKKIQTFAHDKDSISLSIHSSTAMNKNIRGFKIMAQKGSVPFAQYLSEKLSQAIGMQMPNKGIISDESDSSFMAYKTTDIVLDLGFLSHADDVALLMNDAFLEQAAVCIADSIKSFYR